MRWVLVFMPLCLCTPDATPPYEDDVKGIGSTADYEGYNIASEILRNSINFSVDPCEDFYEFTCGNWIASHPIPEDRVSYDYDEMLTDKVQEQLRGPVNREARLLSVNQPSSLCRRNEPLLLLTPLQSLY